MFEIKNNHFRVLCNTQDELDTVIKYLKKLGLTEKSWSGVGVPCIVGKYDMSEKGMRYTDYSTDRQNGEMLSIPELQHLVVWDSISIDDVAYRDNELKDSVSTILSPKEALLALADGDVLQYSEVEDVWVDMDMSTHFKRKFRKKLKPKIETVKVELEIPKPFTPKVGEDYYYLDSDRDKGYSCQSFNDDKCDKEFTQFGAWCTEDEIRLVVEALREGIVNAE